MTETSEIDSPTTDPEEDFIIEIRARIRGYGKGKHRIQAAYTAAKALDGALGGPDSVRTFYEGKPVFYDGFVDDMHHPDHQPWWEAEGIASNEGVLPNR